MEHILEVYGKEIKKDNNKFISCSAKVKEGFVNVRFTRDCGYSARKGLQKVQFDMDYANLKETTGSDGKKHRILYISKATGIEYTEQEKKAMQEKQSKKIADLF